MQSLFTAIHRFPGILKISCVGQLTLHSRWFGILSKSSFPKLITWSPDSSRIQAFLIRIPANGPAFSASRLQNWIDRRKAWLIWRDGSCENRPCLLAIPFVNISATATLSSALSAILRSNIEVTDLTRYDLWFEQKFGIPTGMRENVSEKILKLSEMESEDIKLLQNLIDDQDKKLYEMISAALDRSGALSVRGAELQLDRRLRVIGR